MAGVEPEVDVADGKPRKPRPGDRWITAREDGQLVERVRNAADDAWDETELASDMPASLARAHELLIALHVENAGLRKQAPAVDTPAPTIAERAATTPTTIVSRPCGGCGKKK